MSDPSMRDIEYATGNRCKRCDELEAELRERRQDVVCADSQTRATWKIANDFEAELKEAKAKLKEVRAENLSLSKSLSAVCDEVKEAEKQGMMEAIVFIERKIGAITSQYPPMENIECVYATLRNIVALMKMGVGQDLEQIKRAAEKLKA